MGLITIRHQPSLSPPVYPPLVSLVPDGTLSNWGSTSVSMAIQSKLSSGNDPVDATGKSISMYGNGTYLSTDVAKFGTKSIYFDGTDNAGFAIGNRMEAMKDFYIGATDWTLSLWIYPMSSGRMSIIDNTTTTTIGQNAFRSFNMYLNNNTLFIDTQAHPSATFGITGITSNQWHHIVYQCQNWSTGSIRVWVNGIYKGQTAQISQFSQPYTSPTYKHFYNTGNPLSIGRRYSTSWLSVSPNSVFPFHGYMDDITLILGKAEYPNILSTIPIPTDFHLLPTEFGRPERFYKITPINTSTPDFTYRIKINVNSSNGFNGYLVDTKTMIGLGIHDITNDQFTPLMYRYSRRDYTSNTNYSTYRAIRTNTQNINPGAANLSQFEPFYVEISKTGNTLTSNYYNNSLNLLATGTFMLNSATPYDLYQFYVAGKGDSDFYLSGTYSDGITPFKSSIYYDIIQNTLP